MRWTSFPPLDMGNICTKLDKHQTVWSPSVHCNIESLTLTFPQFVCCDLEKSGIHLLEGNISMQMHLISRKSWMQAHMDQDLQVTEA